MLPDADAIGFIFRVPYDSMWGHRGITHSIAFSIVVGSLVTLIAFRNETSNKVFLATYFALVTLSHPLLDMLTNGGLGVALFAPFSDERFFWPWRPIEVSPIGLSFFSERGLAVFASEIVWVWLPALGILAIGLAYKHFKMGPRR
jgi:inner membrane protein